MIQIEKLKQVIGFKSKLFLLIILILVMTSFFSGTKESEDSASHFIAVYSNYDDLSKKHETAAYVPGVNSNKTRAEVDRVLATVLTDSVSNNDRLSMSKDGLILIKDLESEIDLKDIPF